MGSDRQHQKCDAFHERHAGSIDQRLLKTGAELDFFQKIEHKRTFPASFLCIMVIKSLQSQSLFDFLER